MPEPQFFTRIVSKGIAALSGGRRVSILPGNFGWEENFHFDSNLFICHSEERSDDTCPERRCGENLLLNQRFFAPMPIRGNDIYILRYRENIR